VTSGVRCNIAHCQREILPTLSAHGVCLGHYLEMASIRLQAALELCQEGRPVEPGAFDWLLSQGDFAAHALAQGGGAADPVERTRLLELLLCLANLHEYAEHHSLETTPSARSVAAAQAR
jgi:hypothetical protein